MWHQHALHMFLVWEDWLSHDQQRDNVTLKWSAWSRKTDQLSRRFNRHSSQHHCADDLTTVGFHVSSILQHRQHFITCTTGWIWVDGAVYVFMFSAANYTAAALVQLVNKSENLCRSWKRSLLYPPSTPWGGEKKQPWIPTLSADNTTLMWKRWYRIFFR